MKSFWGYGANKEFSVGCTGQTVYLFDSKGIELGNFKDIKYAYTPLINPNNKLFVVRSTEGWLAVYSLETFTLLKKIKFSPIGGAQDEGFCFSPDGCLFFNIEKPRTSVATELGIYEVPSFQEKRRIYQNEDRIVLKHIEYEPQDDQYSVLGFFRGTSGVYEEGFTASLREQGIEEPLGIQEDLFTYLNNFKRVEQNGFTKKYRELYRFPEDIASRSIRLSEVYRRQTRTLPDLDKWAK